MDVVSGAEAMVRVIEDELEVVAKDLQAAQAVYIVTVRFLSDQEATRGHA